MSPKRTCPSATSTSANVAPMLIALIAALLTPATAQDRSAEALCYACTIGLTSGSEALRDTLACNGHQLLPESGAVDLYKDAPRLRLHTSDGVVLGVDVEHDDVAATWAQTQGLTEHLGVKTKLGATRKAIAGDKTRTDTGLKARGYFTIEVEWDKPAQSLSIRGGDGAGPACSDACPACPQPEWSFDPQRLSDLLYVLGAPVDVTPVDLLNRLMAAGYQSEDGDLWRHDEFGAELIFDNGRLVHIVAGEYAFGDLPVELPRRREMLEHVGLVRRPELVGEPAVVVYDASTTAVERFLVFEVGFEAKGYTERVRVTAVQDRWAPTGPRIADAQVIERYLVREGMLRRSGDLPLIDAMGTEVWVAPPQGWACDPVDRTDGRCFAPPDHGLDFEIGMRAQTADELVVEVMAEVSRKYGTCDSPTIDGREGRMDCAAEGSGHVLVWASEVGEHTAVVVEGHVKSWEPGSEGATRSAFEAFRDHVRIVVP